MPVKKKVESEDEVSLESDEDSFGGESSDDVSDDEEACEDEFEVTSPISKHPPSSANRSQRSKRTITDNEVENNSNRMRSPISAKKGMVSHSLKASSSSSLKKQTKKETKTKLQSSKVIYDSDEDDFEDDFTKSKLNIAATATEESLSSQLGKRSVPSPTTAASLSPSSSCKSKKTSHPIKHSSPSIAAPRPSPTPFTATTTGPPMKPVNISAIVDRASRPDITQGPPIATENQGKKLIKNYMMQQNRPYSVIQVTDNLHQRVQKSQVERIMGALVGERVLRVKEYGKSKIYFPNQDTVKQNLTIQGISTSPNDLSKLTKENDVLYTECERLAQEDARLASTLAMLEQEPTDDELSFLVNKIESEVEQKKAQMARLGGVSVDPQVRLKAIQSHNFYLRVWKQRRRQAMEFAADVAESMDKKTKDVLAIFGCELDETEGAVMPDMIPEAKPQNGLRVR
jgi:hypothetical protein